SLCLPEVSSWQILSPGSFLCTFLTPVERPFPMVFLQALRLYSGDAENMLTVFSCATADS
ncbi:MAG TPA: hypothetical protein VFN35_01860, partial [Ktedonobacteraceae bacterium]|nr:hypothetical protein [Ktedonobacteraceae bacterium]